MNGTDVTAFNNEMLHLHACVHGAVHRAGRNLRVAYNSPGAFAFACVWISSQGNRHRINSVLCSSLFMHWDQKIDDLHQFAERGRTFGFTSKTKWHRANVGFVFRLKSFILAMNTVAAGAQSDWIRLLVRFWVFLIEITKRLLRRFAHNFGRGIF